MTANPDAGAPALILGLGNPGSRYAANRHNAGFMVVDALAAETHPVRWELRCSALTAGVVLEGRRVLLAKPQTYMNASGASARLLAEALGLSPRDFLVVFDDLNLPFGRLRVRPAGSAGGHHGLESIIDALGSEDVPRIRLGIGEENMPADKTAFVLSDFPAASETGLRQMIASAAGAAKTVVRDGIDRAMSLYNA